MKYRYKVISGKGRYYTGEIEAENRDHVIRSLLAAGYTIIWLRAIKAAGRDIKLRMLLKKVNNKDLTAMTRQMSTMISAGMPLLKVLAVLQQQERKPMLAAVLKAVKKDLSEGTPLWESLQKHPRVFSAIYVNLVRAGETGGILGKVLEELCQFMEWEQKISSKVKAASIYPCLVALFAIIISVFLLVFIMPAFMSMFQASALELPLPTRLVMSCSHFLQGYWLLLLAAAVLLYAIFKGCALTRKGSLFLDKIYLRLPVVGKIISRLITARFARTLGSLLAAGIPVVPALEVLEGVTGNLVIGEAIARARLNITRGDSIAGPLEETGAFDPIIIQMIAAGEMSGSLDHTLMRMASYFDQEAVYIVESLLAALEPVLIMIVAILVGLIVAATMLPIFQLSTTLT